MPEAPKCQDAVDPNPIFWCPMGDCLTSIESFGSLQLLAQHELAAHGHQIPSANWRDAQQWQNLAASLRELEPISAADALSVAAAVAAQDSTEQSTALIELAAVLVEAAAASIATPGVRDLSCVQCRSMLFQPVTMQDGHSVCLACVKKYNGSEPEAKWYGTAVNVTLQAVAQRCMPEATHAASLRMRGNDAFKQGEHDQALELYSEALERCSSDSGALCSNRSVVRIKLGDVSGALHDADCAIRAAAGWSKPWYRRYTALNAMGEERQNDALHALVCARACAGDEADGRTLSKALSAALKTRVQTELSDDLVLGRVAAGSILEPQTVGGQLCAVVMKPPVLMETGAAGEAGTAVAAGNREIQKVDLDRVLEELECALCCNTLCSPSAMPCGHVVCRNCLARLLDHAFDKEPSCPMCRQGAATVAPRCSH